MGHVYMTVKLGSRNGHTLKHTLVDTGAWYTFVKPSVIKKIDAKYLYTDEIELGNKKIVKAKVFVAPISYGKRRFKGAMIATFDKCATAIGTQALEGMGIWIDARNKKIVAERPANIMYYH